MIRKRAIKKCKGTGKAFSFDSCKEVKVIWKFGLCLGCFKKWLNTTKEGNEYIKSMAIKAKKDVKKEHNKELREQKKAIRAKSPKEKFYKSTAWKYCSRYVLLYYANDDWEVECSTSGRKYKLPNRAIHAGHYHKKDQHSSVAFEFKNIAPQSYTDNVHFSGKPEIMKQWLIKQHGKDVMDFLNFKKNKTKKLDDSEYEIQKEKYKKLFDDLVKIKGNPWK